MGNFIRIRITELIQKWAQFKPDIFQEEETSSNQHNKLYM